MNKFALFTRVKERFYDIFLDVARFASNFCVHLKQNLQL